jgi:hypothetical protein
MAQTTSPDDRQAILAIEEETFEAIRNKDAGSEGLYVVGSQPSLPMASTGHEARASSQSSCSSSVSGCLQTKE